MAQSLALRALVQALRDADMDKAAAAAIGWPIRQAIAAAEVALAGGGTVQTPVQQALLARSLAREAARHEAVRTLAVLDELHLQILVLRAKGLGFAAVGSAMGFAEKTMANYTSRALDDIGGVTTAEAAVMLTRAGYV
jgi:DNA-binding NarL/FixJ family response regulator